MLEVFCNRGELIQFAAILEKVQMPPAPFVVSWTAHNALKTEHAKCSPEHILAIPSLGLPSKPHWATRRFEPNPNAAVKSSSGLIYFLLSPRSPKTQIPCLAPPNKVPDAFAVGPQRGTTRGSIDWRHKSQCSWAGSKPRAEKNARAGTSEVRSKYLACTYSPWTVGVAKSSFLSQN
jgi:hypothetical protein